MHFLILCIHWASSTVNYQNKPVAPPSRMTEEGFEHPAKLSFGGIHIERQFSDPPPPSVCKI